MSVPSESLSPGCNQYRLISLLHDSSGNQNPLQMVLTFSMICWGKNSVLTGNTSRLRARLAKTETGNRSDKVQPTRKEVQLLSLSVAQCCPLHQTGPNLDILW